MRSVCLRSIVTIALRVMHRHAERDGYNVSSVCLWLRLSRVGNRPGITSRYGHWERNGFAPEGLRSIARGILPLENRPGITNPRPDGAEVSRGRTSIQGRKPPLAINLSPSGAHEVALHDAFDPNREVISNHFLSDRSPLD